uniref:4-coumarate--CoA ligase n=1 Tax=Aegilops tauschii subsp. strangulata TaxID=200361 RepID=A0A453F5H8_AEGTS
MAEMQHVVKVEEGRPAADGRPSVGPTYRSAFARDGFLAPVDGLDSCYDIFRMAVEKYPNNRMLGHRAIVDGKAGAYVWRTYKEVFDIANKIGNSIRSCGLTKGSRCGIYGANSPEWIITMEACNAHGVYCVPLYDTLGAGAIEFILCHAEVEIAFAEEKKVAELLKTFPKSTEFLKTIVSFGKVTQEQKEEVSKYGLSIYSWDEFISLAGDQEFDLPVNQRTDICTIMYTSGTTGDPKGVLISNASIICLIAGVDRLLNSVNERVRRQQPLCHVILPHDQLIFNFFCYVIISAGGNRRLYVLSSSCSYL